MYPNYTLRWLVAVLLAAAVCSKFARGAEPSTNDWLRGSGKDLQIRLHGEVFDSDGQPAQDPNVTCGMNSTYFAPSLEPTLHVNQFEIWLPVNKANQFSMWLMARSSDNNQVAYRLLNAFELRQAAIDGIRLTLKPATRHKTFLVQYEQRPVAAATVKIELGFGIELRAKTDADGVAHFDLLPDQQISQVTAWTDDFRIGGYTFGRRPTHDPNDDEFNVELSKCRDQRMRIEDEQGSPLAGVELNLQVATPSPNFSFLGANEHSRIRSDESGEIVYRWFPDWKQHFFYAELLSTGWVLVGNAEDGPQLVGDTYVFKLKRCQARKQVVGHVTSTNTDVGGFYVTLNSFQGEQENYSDAKSTFTDADGSFRVDVLPEARYCAWALDARWVGNIIDLIPYSPSLGQINSPELSVSAGQEVEVLATVGALHEPYANLSISFRREHSFQWQESGETRRGSGGPQWWTTTDESGRAATRTLPGKLDVSVYTPKWRSEQSVNVRPDQATQVLIHRDSYEKHTVHGRLVFADGFNLKPSEVDIQTAAVDGKVSDQQTPVCGTDGSFSFETLGSEVAVFAFTHDGRLAGAAIVKQLNEPFELALQPTLSYSGQLVDTDHRPLVGHRVVAHVRIENGKEHAGANPTWFDARQIETRTDQQGNYTLAGVPGEISLELYSDAIDDPNRLEHFEEVMLQRTESRPRKVTEIGKRGVRAVPIPVAGRFRNTLRDCAASGYRPLVIVANGTGPIAEFVHEHFVDAEKNGEVSGFVPITLANDQGTLKAEDLAFLKSHDWQLPEPGHILAVALKADGTELGRLKLDARDSQAAQAAADFVHDHALPQHDPEQEWSAAFAEAKRSNRRVWARVSGRYCGPCFSLARWLDEQHTLLEKDYVMLKIDDVRDANGVEVVRRITRGKQHGIPFYAIFESDGPLLIDSLGPLGNIGFPGDSIEGQRHLRKMLTDTRLNLTDAEIDQLIESLGK
jgi:hypothetical protein